MVKNLKRTLALMLSIIMICSSTLMTYADNEGNIAGGEAETSAQVEETVAAEAETSTKAPEAEATTQEIKAEPSTEAMEAVKPEITEQPENAAVRATDIAEFTLETKGQVKTYQWQTAEALDGAWKNLNRHEYGSSATLKIRDVEKFNKNFFRCIVTFNDDTTLKSDEVRLTIVEENDSTARVFGSSKDVKVYAPDGAFPVGTEMSAVEVEDTDAVQSIVDDMDDVSGTVFNAVDITFDKGGEVQPKEEVKVTMNVGTEVDFEKLSLVHIYANENQLSEADVNAEMVDFTYNKEAGTITFDANHFSVYALVWGENQATITWGYMDGDTFKELEEGSTVTLDTTASTVSLENTYAGYYMIGAEYKANSISDWVDINPARLTKTANGWQITTVSHNADDSTTTQTVEVANGSEIRVIYGPKSGPTPSGADDDTVASPTTKKTVTDNKDGTYTIQLDITGNQVQEIQQTGANVLMVLDTTYSMANSMTGATNRFEAARSAALTLIDTLDCGTNDIDLALVEFNSVGSIKYNWTKDYTSFRNYIANTTQHASGPTGTNWESGLYYARQVLADKDNDATYVIFLTDGEPNRRGTTNSTSVGTSTAISYALDQAKEITALSSTSIYGVFCGSDSGYNNLANMITNASGVKTINGTDSTTLKNEFKAIAQTIVDNLGASNVAVDDGIPNLSGISANVVGEAGGYKYYKKGKDETTFTEWADAPGAVYSKDNGVTWDLSSAGSLPASTTYRIRFTVWPSQAAYDLIADLNNGKVNYDDLPADQKAAVTGSKETGYTLLTNTHLNTTYTFKGTEYSDAPDYSKEAMPLPTKKISVQKNWPENMLDKYGVATYRDEDGNEQTATEIHLNLQRDNEDYLDVLVKGTEGWKKDDIYVSCGNMSVKDDVVTIHETGHDYQIVEPAAFSYYWDLISDVYHPMVINGTPYLLVLDETATTADNDDTFEINGKIYRKHADNDNILEASNYRRSNLNLTKNVSTEGAKDGYFTYTAKVKDANSTDGYVWFSAWDSKAEATVKATDWVISGATAQAGNTGYWYATNGAIVTFKIKAGWNVRFLNLFHGSTFEFEETDMPQYYAFEKAEATKQSDFMDTTISDDDWRTINDKKVTGTIIEPNNSYTVTYTNKFEAFYVYHSSVKGHGNLETINIANKTDSGWNEDGTYSLYAKTTAGTLYGGYYLDYKGKGSYADDGLAKDDGVAYTGMNYEWSGAQTKKGTEITPVAGETYYIKEVPTYYLRNYHQINFMKESKELKALYLISAVDDLNYKETGLTISNANKKSKVVSQMTFKNYSTNKSVVLKANTVFKSLGITEEGEYLTYFDATNTEYFNTGSFSVLPYWTTLDGITVNGISTRTITISSMTKSGITKSDQ